MTLFLAFCVGAPGQAQELNSLSTVRQSSSAENIRLVFELAAPPEYAVYLAGGPDRLVIDLANTGAPDVKLGNPPSNGLVEGWGVKQVNLTRAQCVVRLAHRLQPSQVKTLVLDNPHRLVVDVAPRFLHEEAVKLTEGVHWLRREEAADGRYLLWNQLSFDPADPNVELDVGLAKDRLDAREPVSSMVQRTGALAGINGGFFAGSGGPLGVVVKDGQVLAPHVSRRPPRTAVGVTQKREVRFDRVAAKGKVLTSRDGGAWTDVTLALGGGPRLLHRGKIALTTDEEELGPKGNDITRVAARTAVATTRDGKMLLVTASGYRDNHSQGTKLDSLATMLLRRGASEAMNLDGGASVDMVIEETIVSDGPGNVTKEKPVATALLVRDARERLYPARVDLSPAQSTLSADGQSQTSLAIQVFDPAGRSVPDGTLVRLFAYGVDLSEDKVVTSGGKAQVTVRSTRHTGPALVRAECGPASGEASLGLVSGPPARLAYRLGDGKLVKDKGVQEVPLMVQADDHFGNPVAGAQLVFSNGGTPAGVFPTDARGVSEVVLTLPASGGEITVDCGGARPLKLQVPGQAEPSS